MLGALRQFKFLFGPLDIPGFVTFFSRLGPGLGVRTYLIAECYLERANDPEDGPSAAAA